jgi:transcriptional regulator with XRE-family HTH domain
MAELLGISQQSVSKLEQNDSIEDVMLEKVAKALGVTSEAIKSFNEQAIFSNMNNTFNDNATLVNYQFNPIDKIVELYDDKMKLYEALLQSEREKIALLEKLLGTTARKPSPRRSSRKTEEARSKKK